MARRPARIAWLLVIVLLLALRLPSLVEPAGSDQGIYGYSGQRLLAGGVLYRDAWDQKPPGIAFVYALLWRVWPHESVVAAADLGAAAAVAGLLVVIGRRRFSENAGASAAAIFLLFGNPSLQRLSGIFVRAQCETFIALAVAVALTLLASRTRRTWQLVCAGAALGAAFWLKYNAITYLLPGALAVWAWRDTSRRARPLAGAWAWMAAGFALVTAGVTAYIIGHGILHDLWLATVDYNLRYSEETFATQSRLAYLLTFPIARAQVEMIWFLGGAGALVLVWQARSSRSALVALAWLAAAILSIVVNGARNLPQYFVQAWPALALAAAAGLGAALAGPRWLRYGAAIVVVAGLWRVGDEGPAFRFGGLLQAVDNLRWDLTEHGDRDVYLGHFRNEQKYDALEIANLARDVRNTTSPGDPVYVFGFSGSSVCWLSGRVSASRFSWSRPVIIDFAAGEPGYGPNGLLQDLQRTRPALVALQHEQQWQSLAFFMGQPALRSWLESGYVLERETAMFAVWRRKA